MPDNEALKRLAWAQDGLVTRTQLRALGFERWTISHRIETERWRFVAPQVVCLHTGELTDAQLRWLGVLHAGDAALVGGLHAAQAAGLQNWSREEITILCPFERKPPQALAGFAFVRTRRTLAKLEARKPGPPTCRLEPAILLFASRERSDRTAADVVAAAVQQQLTSPNELRRWLEALEPLPRAALLRRAIDQIAGGAHSTAELDVARMCRRYGLTPPARQVKRHDSSGRTRYTDCEWPLPDGRTVVLEVDGSFHMRIEHWEDDIARQRALTSLLRLVIRCTATEVRDRPESVARDLIRLGVQTCVPKRGL